MGLKVSSVSVDNIRYVGHHTDTSADPDPIWHLRGVMRVVFHDVDPTDDQQLLPQPIMPVEAEVTFLTDSTGRAQTCDVQGEVRKYFSKKHEKFIETVRSDLQAMNGSFRAQTENRVPNAVSNSAPLITRDYDEALVEAIQRLRSLRTY